ncbi:STAS domain-containing protein [Polymorphospora rubra]|uniref:Anti-sigma factor antagonist n=1 Tax=Polymorphospora rubra TaxID=338584 RepID=A0A810NCZ5_9ACTN|nr:STAS domain-containing protein [Polymorphospora rubra]BCJ69165.1 hypothetical protein Prubr_61860 [Polymorphospora rubra]
MQLLIRQTESGTQVRFTLEGEIDLATVGDVRDAVIATLARSRPRSVVLDLALVTFIDSTGIGELVACHKAATVSGAELVLESLSPFVRRQIWATGLLGLFGLPTDSPLGDPDGVR